MAWKTNILKNKDKQTKNLSINKMRFDETMLTMWYTFLVPSFDEKLNCGDFCDLNQI
jgi:hypothetical protein